MTADRKMNNPAEVELCVINALGIWSLVRDLGLSQRLDGLPTALQVDFVRFRKAAASASVDSLEATLSELSAVYAQLGNTFSEASADALLSLKKREEHLLRAAILGRESYGNHSIKKFETYLKASLRRPNGSFSQLYAGAIERCLMSGSEKTNAYAMGAALSGPLFFGFVHRLLLEARKDGVTRIYFLARDGCLLLKMAKILNETLDLGLDLRYLFTSRKATRFPSIHRLNERDFGWIFERMDTDFTLSTLAARLQAELDFLIPLFSQDTRKLFESLDPETVLNEAQVQKLEAEFLNNRKLAEAIESAASEARKRVNGYYRQEGVFDQTKIGLVDVGWLGTLQDAIHRVMMDEPDCPQIIEYYFGCSKYSEDTTPSNQKKPFFLLPSKQPGYGPLFELILLADHGMTLGYNQLGDGSYEAKLKIEGTHHVDWGLKDYFQGACDFSQVFANSLLHFGDCIEPAYDEIVPELITLLKRGEITAAETFGILLYSGNQEETHLREIAPPLTASEAFRFIIGGKETRRRMTQWTAASFKRSSSFVQFILMLDPRTFASAALQALKASRNPQ